MGLVKSWVVLSMGAAVAACSSAPPVDAGNGAAQVGAAQVGAAPGGVEASQPAAPSAARAGGKTRITPDLVVDARDQHPGSTVKCREMLSPASNVIVKKCMTIDDWKAYDAAQSEAAKRFLRSLRGEQ